MNRYDPLRFGLRYLNHQWSAGNPRGHGIHSPFVFEFLQEVLNDRRHFEAYDRVEELRRRLRRDVRPMDIIDLGAGSGRGSAVQTVSQIVRRSSKPARLGQLLFRIARHYRCRRILELGTSLGLSAAYLGLGGGGKLITADGNPAVAAMAEDHLQSLGLREARVYRGAFEEVLPAMLDEMPELDLAFIDGNHREEPTLRYFGMIQPHLAPGGLIVLDDIHWSRGMESAWRRIRSHPAVRLSMDLFFIGIVSCDARFRTPLHVQIRF